MRRIAGRLLRPIFLVMALPTLASGLTVEQLHRDASLTPEKFSRLALLNSVFSCKNTTGKWTLSVNPECGWRWFSFSN